MKKYSSAIKKGNEMNISNNKEEIATNAMRQAMAWLDDRGIYYQYLPPHQLKLGAINFWPRTGTITVDGEPQRRPVKGIAGLKSILVTGR